MPTIQNLLSEVKSYKPAQLYTGKLWYVGYYAYNPETQKLERCVMRLMHIKTIAARRAYASELIKRLNSQLEKGWNPFIDPEKQKQYVKLVDAVEQFLTINRKKLSDGNLSKDSYKDYKSRLGTLVEWLKQQGRGDLPIYKFERALIVDFLEHVYLERGVAALTRNNYLTNISVFCGWMLEKEYVKSRPTDGIKPLKRNAKQRTVIDNAPMNRIFEYLEEHNKYYLLACKFMYFTLIRPKEMTYVQIKHLSFSNQTVFLDGAHTKNGKDAMVTLPATVINLMIELNIHTYPSEMNLFSKNFKPGTQWLDPKRFRDYWNNKLRPALNLPPNLQFYSFKDTGITNMLIETGDSLAVRDQARHSSIAITDIYTPHNRKKANDKLKNIKLDQ